MFKLLFQSFLFILFIFILTSCSESPKWPDQDPKMDPVQKIISPAEQRLQQANQLFSTAMSNIQPKKNHLLLDIVDFLATPIPDLNLPGINEYSLIETILKNVDQNFLGEKQNNRYLLGHIKVLMSKQQFEKAGILLDKIDDENFSALTPLQQHTYYQMRVEVYLNTQQALLAVKELIKNHHLINMSPPILELKELDNSNQYLATIWEIMSSFQIQELENQLLSQLEQSEKKYSNFFDKSISHFSQIQLMGWQQLMIIVKKHAQKYQIIKQLNAWSESFPKHMANRSFILAQLELRFKLLNNPQQIALLLPAQGKYAKPSQVIVNGFLAAHYQQSINNKLLIRLYDTTEYGSIWPSYNKAVDEGADIIIGPFEKKHIMELSQSKELPVITLALNNINYKTQHKTAQLFQFALTPEDEIKIITQKAKQKEFKNAALIVPDSKWGKRLELAYTQYWQELGGVIVASQTYPAKTYDYSAPIKQLLQLDKSEQRKAQLNQTIGFNFEFTPRRRQDIDVIFLAAFPKQAKQIPLQITYNHGADIPVYATSHIIRKAFNKNINADLNGITYTDMPWLLNPNLTVISRITGQKQAAYQRLFSFGVDSYQIIPYLKLMGSNSAEQFSGDTGILNITNMGYIKRQIPTAIMVKGKAVINK
jgi:outer membrane PBP1 activator LpoA protein